VRLSRAERLELDAKTADVAPAHGAGQPERLWVARKANDQHDPFGVGRRGLGRDERAAQADVHDSASCLGSRVLEGGRQSHRYARRTGLLQGGSRGLWNARSSFLTPGARPTENPIEIGIDARRLAARRATLYAAFS
jgi:hypothetical protein